MLHFILRSITLGYLKAWKKSVDSLTSQNIMGVDSFKRLTQKGKSIEAVIYLLEREV